MIYKIYKDKEGYWIIEKADISAKPEYHWWFVECFRFRWQARRYVKKLKKGQPIPNERYVEIH